MSNRQGAAAGWHSGGNRGAHKRDRSHDSTHPLTSLLTSIPPTRYAMTDDELELFRSIGTPLDIGPALLVVTPSQAEFVGFMVMEQIPPWRAFGCATVAQALQVASGMRTKGRATRVLVLRGGDE
jgi:hypothetical protein